MNVRPGIRTLLLLYALTLLATGCSLLDGEATPTTQVVVIPTVGATSTSPAATDLPAADSPTVAPVASPTLAAAVATPTLAIANAAATATTSATAAVPAGRDQRIQFAPGGTSAAVENSIASGVVDRYTLGAQAGQTMSVSLTTTGGDATFELFTPTGARLYGGSFWQGQLPASGDYLILVRAGVNDVSYRLDVTIPPLAGGDDGDDGDDGEPTRIEFTPGTTAAQIEGEVGAGEVDSYVLRALESQSMSAYLITENEQTFLSISGENGEVYLRSALGQSGWYVPALPATQDYYIAVVATGGAASYTLEVAISPLDNRPARIEFAPGATSAMVSGALAAGGDIDSYILGAAAGQEIRVDYEPASGPLTIFLQKSDGSAFFSSSSSPLVATLPQDGDYLLSLSTPNAAGPVDYTMTVTIE